MHRWTPASNSKLCMAYRKLACHLHSRGKVPSPHSHQRRRPVPSCIRTPALITWPAHCRAFQKGMRLLPCSEAPSPLSPPPSQDIVTSCQGQGQSQHRTVRVVKLEECWLRSTSLLEGSTQPCQPSSHFLQCGRCHVQCKAQNCWEAHACPGSIVQPLIGQLTTLASTL
jgi:hypothetical protein